MTILQEELSFYLINESDKTSKGIRKEADKQNNINNIQCIEYYNMSHRGINKDKINRRDKKRSRIKTSRN